MAVHELNLRKLNRKTIRLFYILSPLVFGGASLVIFRLRGVGVAEAFRAQAPPAEQILVGLLVGIGSGLAVGLGVARSSRLASLRKIIHQVFEAVRPNLLDLFLTSASAGFSEELLFRGAVQPLLGIWITSLLFALAHGGGAKASKGNLFFGLFIFGISLLLGVVYVEVGLLAGMVTHFALDFAALLQYRRLVAANPAGQPSRL